MIPTPLARPEPLSHEDFDQLSRLLESIPGAPALPWIHGLLTAVVSAPSLIPPRVWIPEIIERPSWASEEQIRLVTSWLLRLHTQCLDDLADQRVTLLGDEDGQDGALALYCGGYLHGVRLDSVWRSDEEAIGLLLPFGVLAGEFELNGETDAAGETIVDSSALVARYRQELPSHAMGFYWRWRQWRRTHATAGAGVADTQPARRPAKIGRDETCPCGSGRRYKRCCGA